MKSCCGIWILPRILGREGNTVELRDHPLSCAGLDGIADVSRTSQAGSILTSEGDRESAVNSARGKAEAQILDAEASKATILQAEAQQRRLSSKPKQNASSKSSRLKPQLKRCKLLLLKTDPGAREVQFLLAQHYLEMGTKIAAATAAKLCSCGAVSQPRWRGCVQLSQTWLRLTRTRCFQPNCHRSIPTTAFIGSNASSLTELALFTQTKTPW